MAVAQWSVNDAKRFISNIKPHQEIVVLGTSHGFDFMSISPRMTFLNFSKDGSTPYYDLQKFRWLHQQGLLEDEAIIILPVSYFAFGLDENRTDRGPSSGFENEFYFYLDRAQIFNYSIKKDLSLRVFAFQQIVEERTGLQKSFGGLYYEKQPLPSFNVDTLSHAGRLRKHASGRFLTHQKLAQYAPQTPNYKYFESLIAEAISHGYRPVLVTVPYSTFYNEKFNQQWLDTSYFEPVKRLAEEQNIPYLNYSDLTSISDQSELFEDSDHLNAKGMQVFNALFFDDLQEFYNLDRIMEK